MHADLALRGWVVWFSYGLTILVVAFAIALLVGASRRPANDFGGLGRWPWVVLQGIVVGVAAFAALVRLASPGTVLPSWLTSAFPVLVSLAAIQQVAYLLRVVWPSPARQATREATRETGAEAALVPGDPPALAADEGPPGPDTD